MRCYLKVQLSNCFCILTAFLAGFGYTAKAQSVSKLPEIKYEKYTLPNGLTVITHEDHRLPLVAVDLWYHVGPMNERPGRTGFAHLFEHMMFQGSEHVGEKTYFKILQAAGASQVNGTTQFDRTNYYETLPSNELELALWLESDRMGFLLEGLDREKLANQRDVVRNERRQGEGQQYSVAWDQVFHMLFPKGHPYYGKVLGSHADIESARIADVRDFYRQFYTPNNASIAIAGDFNPQTLRALLMKWFGPIPSGPKVEPVNGMTPPITSQRRGTVTDSVQLSQVEIAWLTPSAYTPESYSVGVAAFALGGAKVSRLGEALVLKAQTAQEVTCGTNGNKLAGITFCSMTAKPGVKLEDLEATFWREVGKLQQEGPTAVELESSKSSDLADKILGLQRLGGDGGVADILNRYNQYTDDPGFLSKDIAMTEAVTVASARSAATKYLRKDTAVVVYCVPGKKILDDVPRSPADTDANVNIVSPYSPKFEASQEWRKIEPDAGSAPALHLPVPVQFKLDNGLKVLLVEEHTLPLITAEVLSRSGSDNDEPGKSGVASLTAQIMSDGTVSRDLATLSSDEERIGAFFNESVAMDSSSISTSVLTSHADKALELLADVAEHPAFRTEDMDRDRKLRLLSIAQEADDVESTAKRVGPELVFGDQPYGFSPDGTTASIKTLTYADITRFYADHYGPQDSALLLVGDVTRAEAERLALKYFGNWSSRTLGETQLPAPTPQHPTRVVIVDNPGAPQTALYAFGLGVPKNSPDADRLDLMNYSLGGSFSSRLNMNLRELHGYTYAASSSFLEYRAGGEFYAGGLVRTDVTAAAAKELIVEIRNISAKPPNAEELAAAREASIRSLSGQFETTSSIATAITDIFLYSRPLDYYGTLPARYRAVTEADISRVAQQYLHPDHLVIVAAGDRAKIEQGLKDASLGPVEVRDINGQLVMKEQ
jgi:zinc protease